MRSSVPEQRQVFDNLTVEENLVLGYQNGECGPAAWTIAQMFDYFPRLKERQSTKAARLSGGEQQMPTICRSLLGSPKIDLVDEPREGLAPQIVSRVVEVIEDIRRHGLAVVLVEQNLTFALRFSDRVHVVGRGRIVHSRAADDMRESVDIRRWLEVAQLQRNSAMA
jgi:branched-chain amino acid transport system ATP-binding protein